MNLVERLLKIDQGEIAKEETRELESKRLQKILGEKKPVTITIKSIDGDTFTRLSAAGLDDDGNYIMAKAYDTTAKIVAAGLTDPNLKDEDLQRHVGASDPADAAKKIFKGEVNNIGTQIADLSGFAIDDQKVEEVKN